MDGAAKVVSFCMMYLIMGNPCNASPQLWIARGVLMNGKEI